MNINVFKRKTVIEKEYHHEDKKRIVDNLYLPLFIGLIVGAIFYFYSIKKNPGELALSILAALISAFACFAFIEWRRNICGRQSELKSIRELSENTLAELARIKYSGLIITHHRGIPIKYIDVLEKILKKSTEDSGGIIVSAGPREYAEYLNDFLCISNNCYFATLRGGKDNPKYTLKWFFEDDNEKDNHFNLTKAEKQAYLQAVNSTKNIGRKIRILLFEKTEDSFKKHFMDDDLRNKFFDLCTNVETYLGPPTLIIEKLGEIMYIPKSKTQFIYEDYAVFDEEVVLKHNGVTSLYVAAKDQIVSFKALFELLKTDGIFEKLTKETIGNIPWNNWKN